MNYYSVCTSKYSFIFVLVFVYEYTNINECSNSKNLHELRSYEYFLMLTITCRHKQNKYLLSSLFTTVYKGFCYYYIIL